MDGSIDGDRCDDVAERATAGDRLGRVLEQVDAALADRLRLDPAPERVAGGGQLDETKVLVRGPEPVRRQLGKVGLAALDLPQPLLDGFEPRGVGLDDKDVIRPAGQYPGGETEGLEPAGHANGIVDG